MRITYEWPGDERPPTLLSTSELVFWVALARIGPATPVRPVKVTLPTVPRDLARLEAYIGTELRGSGLQTCR